MHSIFISRVHSVIFSPQLVQRVCVTITSILGQSPFPPHPCFPNNLLGVKIAEHNKQKCRSDVHCKGKQAGNNPVWRCLVGMWRRSCWLSGAAALGSAQFKMHKVWAVDTRTVSMFQAYFTVWQYPQLQQLLKTLFRKTTCGKCAIWYFL